MLLLLYAPLVELHAIFGRATAIAKMIVGREGETRTLDQVRADVVCDLLIDGVTDALPAEARGIRASVVVTVPVLSLLDDDAAKTADPPVVEGIGPIPLSRGPRTVRRRRHPGCGSSPTPRPAWCSPSDASSTGHPPSLRKLTKWRADRCMAPGCGMPASRCEIDHNIAWEDGGETSLENHAPFCKGHHIVKHHGGWDVRQIDGSGGAIEWTSPTGRRYIVQPERRVPVFRASADTRRGHSPRPSERRRCSTAQVGSCVARSSAEALGQERERPRPRVGRIVGTVSRPGVVEERVGGVGVHVVGEVDAGRRHLPIARPEGRR